MLIQSLGCAKIIVQTDNVTVVEALNLNEGYSMIATPILNECRSLLFNFGKVLVEHCNRESKLARFGRSNPPTLWSDTPLSFIIPLLADDVSLI